MISKVLRVITCSFSFLYTFYVLCKLTYFLSKPSELNLENNLIYEENKIVRSLWILVTNTSLLSAFIIQHSAMSSDAIKDFYRKFNVDDIERSIYNASSAAVLHLLISKWQTVPWVAIWNFNTIQNNKLWLVISIFQIIGWCIVYIGCVMMDISELAGLKQVYYKISGRPCPMTMKSRELQRYFLHMRHPSFTGFFIVLWVHPFMSLDRLFIAFLLTVYMILMWRIDPDDYCYHSIIYERKERELSNKNI